MSDLSIELTGGIPLLGVVMSGKIDYMGQPNVDAVFSGGPIGEVKSNDLLKDFKPEKGWSGKLLVVAKPPIVADGYRETNYSFHNGYVQIEFWNEGAFPEYVGDGNLVGVSLIKRPNDIAYAFNMDNPAFGSHRVTDQEADEIVKAGYDGLRQLLQRVPPVIKNPSAIILEGLIQRES